MQGEGVGWHGVGASSAGGVGVAGEPEGSADDVAQGRPHRGGVAGVDPAGVFAERHLSDPVDAVLDGPVDAGPGRDLPGAGLVGGEVGDGEDRLAGPFLGAEAAAPAADPSLRDPQAINGASYRLMNRLIAIEGGITPVS